MNRIIAGVMLAGAIVGSIPPDAHGDPGNVNNDPGARYVADLALAGVPVGTPAQETYVGELICHNLAGGMTTTATALRLINGAGTSTDEAIAIVGLAVIDMCPQYAPVPIVHPTTPLMPAPVDPGHFTVAHAIA